MKKKSKPENQVSKKTLRPEKNKFSPGRQPSDQSSSVAHAELFNVFDAMKDIVHVITSQYELQYVNPVTEKQYGLYKKGRKCYDYFYGRQEICDWCRTDEVLKGKVIHEEWFSPVDQKTYDLINMPLINADGSASKLVIAEDITDRKQAEHLLKQERDRLLSIFDSMQDGVCLYNQNYDIEYVNQTLKDEFGPVKDQKCHQYFHGKTQPCPDCQHEKVFQNQTFRWECYYPQKEKTFDLVATPLKNIDGSISKLEIFRDITARKRAREAIEESLSLHQATLESTTDGILVVDLDGKWTSFNQKFIEMWQIPNAIRQSRDGKKALEFALARLKDPQGFISKVKALYHQTDKDSFDFLEFKDGRIIERYSHPQRIGKKIVGRVWSFRDVTTRRLAEDALYWSEKELSLMNRISNVFLTASDEEMYLEVLKIVLEALESPYGVFGYIDENGALVCPSMTRDVGEQCQVPNKDIVFHRKDLGGIWSQTLTEKKSLFLNRPFSVPAGHIKVTRVLTVPIIYQNKAIGNFLVGNKVTDYTERDKCLLENIAHHIAPVLAARLQREAQERARRRTEIEKDEMQAQLLQSQKMEAIGRLTGGIAHDFNNLLTVIQGYTELLMLGLGRDDPSYEKLNNIHQATTRASELTRQLLLFGRKKKSQVESLDLNSIVKDMLTMIKRVIGEDVVIKTELADNPQSILGDKSSIEQVIMNIAINARDAMPKGGMLKIQTENVILDEDYVQIKFGSRLGRFVRLVISDTGVGMDKETKERLFEPFFTTKDIGKGTGLGLSVVYGVVKQHDGWIYVYSELGQGTVFQIYLPVNTAKSVIEKRKKTSILKYQGCQERILLVEDEKKVRELLTEVLQQNNYLVFPAVTVKEAREVFQQEKGRFDLVFSDTILPDGTGLELVDWILKQKPEFPVLMSSGYSDARVHHSPLKDADLPFLPKPYSINSLLKNLRDILDKRK